MTKNWGSKKKRRKAGDLGPKAINREVLGLFSEGMKKSINHGGGGGPS